MMLVRLLTIYQSLPLSYYLYFKVEKFVEGQICICRHHPTLDPYGHHLGTGCLNGGFTMNTHQNPEIYLF